jgi:hypothetical protein
MKLLLSISLLTIISCGTHKETQTKNINCITAEHESELDVSRLDSTNSRMNFEILEQSGEFLTFSITYSGGCEKHNFHLVKKPSEKDQEYHNLKLIHHTNGDYCREKISDTICFDLTPLELKKGDFFIVEGKAQKFKVD